MDEIKSTITELKTKIEDNNRKMEQMQISIDSLTSKLNSYTQSSTVPLELEYALIDRGFLKINNYTIMAQDSNVGYQPEAVLTIDRPGIPEANAFPDRFLQLQCAGRIGTLYLVGYNLAEFG